MLRDAELFAAIGEVLSKDGMADADTAEYKAFSNKLRDGASKSSTPSSKKTSTRPPKPAPRSAKRGGVPRELSVVGQRTTFAPGHFQAGCFPEHIEDVFDILMDLGRL